MSPVLVSVANIGAVESQAISTKISAVTSQVQVGLPFREWRVLK
ncbi:hypothetical protein GALL_478540 [mine drainage metagenome]|uniref:Uncharacterized protein n=1 Tax=mine drainage metagenome TaxID=410659 RepID=A0A1J5PGI4_9ZZZZ